MFWLISCTGGEVAEVPGPPTPPSVLFVVIDTLRADHVGAYGHHRATTPALDELAAGGLRFADATIPASWTWPGHASLFTGEPPWVHGAHHAEPTGDFKVTGKEKSVEGIRPGMKTFAGYFRDAGYSTVAVAGNNLLDPRFGLVRGFEEVLASVPDPIVVERASEVLAEERDAPLLLFVNLMSAHAPYAPSPAPWIDETERSWWDGGAPDWLLPFVKDHGGQPVLAFTKASGFGVGHPLLDGTIYDIPPAGVEFIGEVYDGGVNMADAHLDVLVRRFAAACPDGIVVVTSDHGEYLGEHELLNHHSTVYRPVTWVPLVISWPGHLEPRVVEEPVSAEQIAGTVLALAGIETPLSSLLESPNQGPIRAQSWVDLYRAGRFGGIFEHGWKLYREGDRALVLGEDGSRELYDLRNDPLMVSPVQGDITELEAAAASAFESFVGVEVDEGLDEALKALGYRE